MASSIQSGIQVQPYQNDTNTFNHSFEDSRSNLYGLYIEYSEIVESKNKVSAQLEEKAQELASKLFGQQFFRLCSFSLRKEEYTRYSALQLALDGFYKTHTVGEIKCFSCGYRYNTRQTRINPFEGHRLEEYGGSCLHLNGQDGRNVPLGQNVVQQGAVTTTIPLHRPDERPDQTTQRDTPTRDRPHVERTISFSSTARRTTARHVPEIQNSRQGTMTDTASTDRRRNVHRQVTLRDYRYELCRLQSYRHWPSNAAASPDDLANAGFYYMGTDDRVQCVFCRGILRCWEPDDRALAEHLRHFPQCPFLIDTDSVGNVPLGDQQEEEGLFSAVQARNEGLLGVPEVHSMEGVISSSPVHPNKAHISARLATFEGFPSNALQKADDLAKAGFFYTGQLDTVRCYFCNIMVSNWKPCDNPWVVHVTKSDRCGFLLISRGKTFIDDVKKNEGKQTRRKAHHKRKTLPVNQGDIEQFMSSSAVRALREDYEENLLLKVVSRRYKELGEGFPNAESLLDAIAEFEEEPEDDEPEDELDDIEDDEGFVKQAKESDLTSQAEGGVEVMCEDIEDLDEETLLRQNAELVEETRCKVCLEERASIVFLKCGHLVCCSSCAPALTKCPICRQRILGTVRVEL